MRNNYLTLSKTALRKKMCGALLLHFAVASCWAQSAPAVVALSPARNAAVAPRPLPVAATFSQPMDAATLSSASVRVFSAQRGGRRAGTYAGGGTPTCAFTAAQPFQAGETVTTSWTTALRSGAGAALATPVVSRFTTDAAPATATFAGGADVAMGTNPAGIVAADLDGDGVLDVATADRGGAIDYAFGNGSGQFTGINSFGFGGTYTALIAADINGDGTLELLSPRVRDATVAVVTNNGTGRAGLGYGTSIAVDYDARQAAAADIDGDGDLDLLVTCYSGTVAIRFNNGLGVFSGTTSVPLNTAYGIATGDVDNDGDVDFIATDYANGLVAVRLNNGHGVFTAGPAIAVGTGPARVALGDANGDGYLDAFAANLTGGTVSVALNTGTGTFQAPVAVPAPNAAEIALGDVDGDGDVDFVVTDYSYGVGVSVRLNNGQGAFSGNGNVTVAGSPMTGQLTNNNPFGVALADMDGNGTLDVLAATYSGVASVRLNAFAPAVLTGSAAAVCAGSNAGTVALTRPYGAIVKYQADTGAGFQDVPGTNTGAVLAFANLATTTTYRAALLTPEGRTVFSGTATVLVNPLPVAVVTPNGPTVFCQGGSVRLTAGGGASYLWSTGATTASVTATASGTYGVTVTSAAGCTAPAALVTVTVNPAPAAVLTAATPTTFCSGGSVVLTAPAGTGYAYQFLRNGTAISGATAGAYTAVTAGAYAVTVTAPSGCAATSAAVVVAVNPATTATFGYATPTFCLSGPNPTPTVTGTAGGTFASTPGLALNAATGGLNLGASTPGTYAVTYTVAGPCGSAATATVTLSAPPVATFRYAPATGGAGSTATVAPTLDPGATAGTFSSTAGLALDPATGALALGSSTGGTYTVTNTLAAAGGCAASTATSVFTVYPRPATPVLTVSYTGTVATFTSSAAAGNQWYFNGALIPGATGQTYVVNAAPAQVGAYTVTTTDANGAVSFPSAALVVAATAPPRAGTSLRVYPNPTPDGKLHVALTGYRSAVELTVLNALGQAVFGARVPASAGTTTQAISLAPLATGIYVLRVKSEGGLETRRLVKE